MEALLVDFERYASGEATEAERLAALRHLEENPAMLPVVLHMMRRHLMAALRLSPLTDPLREE